MDIRVLQYFVTIVQTKSISNAAQALHVTQPTLSRQIKDLEEELETILFYRGSREIQLTEDGRYLYNRAIEILALVNKTENNIKRTDSISGEIYIGVAESQSLDIIAKAVKELTENYPETKVHLRSGNADFVQEYLDQGLFDIGVTFGPFDERKYSQIALQNRDAWGVLVPKNHPLTKIDKPKLHDIIHYPLIVSSQSNNDSKDLAGLGDYRIVATYNLLYNASLLVKAGVGIALCLDGIVPTDYDHSQLAFVRLQEDIQDPFQVIWKKQSNQSPVAKEFLKILENLLLSGKKK
ncbi:LysR family transcriptional regulator [Streptococcus varani]|uniref:LysR family transcriptional regulator n=1 Tax=Streptococcus varani TaxID=1608583 RepID=A0A0E4CS28_9STRE|nr:LysR family transcriptional regulator [Streptococcus varani]CQR24062.1 LysR family transcriptional regulator [Streptococcus varani]